MHFLQQLHSLTSGVKDPAFSFDGTLVASIYVNRLDILQWLLDEAKVPVESTLLEDAILAQKLDIAAWLIEHYPAACTKYERVSQTQLLTFRSNKLTQTTMDWFQSNQEAQDTLDIGAMARNAVMEGKIEWFDVFYQMNPVVVMARTDLVDQAAAKGHLSMIKHLVEVGYPYISTDAMDNAISNKHFDVVRFLHEHYSGRRTENAPVDATVGSGSDPEAPRSLHRRHTDERPRNGSKVRSLIVPYAF